MSIICLICKGKLLNSAPESSLGSLNSLVENQVITTDCGHLYHQECLLSWFRTQKKKIQNQGMSTNVPDQCPTCGRDIVDAGQLRRVYLLEDHRDSLEKAKLMEKLENLEIYCHQLEVHINQLRSENDLLLNKALTPCKHNLGKDEFAAIVKNDRVIWMKKDSSPLSGIVLSIFKKDKSLWVKLRLDKKIRTNNRSGALFSSFRFDKNKEITVPFEEIVLEKDYQKNNAIDENSISSACTPTTPNLRFLPQRDPSFRNSTLSLPGEYLSPTQLYDDRIRPIGSHPLLGSYDYINSFGSVNSVQMPYNNIQNHNPDFSAHNSRPTLSINLSPSSAVENGLEESHSNQDSSDSDQREYVILREGNSSDILEARQALGRSSSSLPSSPSPTSETKKHVTFADDLLENLSPTGNGSSNHFRDHNYKNVSDMPFTVQERVNAMLGVPDEGSRYLKVSKVDLDEDDEELNFEQVPMQSPSTQNSEELPANVSNGLDAVNPLLRVGDLQNANQRCFDITLTTLFLQCDVFDNTLLNRSLSYDNIQTTVQSILIEGFVKPIRESRKYEIGYSTQLHDAISHLCSSVLDLEELMTILFESVFKIPPFISYSFDMCDYIHQFFINFTDKAKKPTVQQLLEKSLLLQDNLKLRREPSPALFLQMPNSEGGNGIIHYEAVIPTLALNLEHILEKDAVKTEALSCYCNKTATLECATCAKIHGKSPVLFCEECSVLLEAIHDQLYHKLELTPIKALNISTSSFELAAVICQKGSSYSTFLRNINEESKWIFIEEFQDGMPKIENLPMLEKWMQSICDNPSNLELKYVNHFQHKILTECRMFLYLPVENSYA